MPDRWFRVSEVGTGTMDDPYRPEFSDRCNGYSSFHIGNSPRFVMRAYADDTTLDGIASESKATELSESQALDKYNSSSSASLDGSNRPVDITELRHRQHSQ